MPERVNYLSRTPQPPGPRCLAPPLITPPTNPRPHSRASPIWSTKGGRTPCGISPNSKAPIRYQNYTYRYIEKSRLTNTSRFTTKGVKSEGKKGKNYLLDDGTSVYIERPLGITPCGCPKLNTQTRQIFQCCLCLEKLEKEDPQTFSDNASKYTDCTHCREDRLSTTEEDEVSIAPSDSFSNTSSRYSTMVLENDNKPDWRPQSQKNKPLIRTPRNRYKKRPGDHSGRDPCHLRSYSRCTIGDKDNQSSW